MKVQFVDCRWELGKPERGRELYLAGHVPGASFLDVESELSAPPGGPDGGRHPLPAPEAFQRAVEAAGIGDDTLVVAYDQGMTGGAARLWWLLRHFGHDAAAVLDGGLTRWLGPLRAGEEEIEPTSLTLRSRGDDTVTAEDIEARLGRPGFVLVDARVPERYRGEVEPIDAVAGHIPGAVNMPYAGPVDEPAGANEVAAYCGSGVTASVTVLRFHQAGVEAKLYPGSWSEWSSRRLPVERG
ncbi:MAG TPA: sulfurtransferase [Gaiellaceae bacterium]